MKQKLNVTGGQLSDWNQNQVNPCTWNSVICDNNNNVIQVLVGAPVPSFNVCFHYILMLLECLCSPLFLSCVFFD
jgi:hypothetical protein